MNAAILNLLTVDVGMTDQNLSDLTGLPLATVQSEIASGISTSEVVTVNSLHFLGSAEDQGPVSQVVDVVTQVQADIAALQSSTGAERTLIHTSGRWYARSGRWYGPSTTYGTEFYNWGTNYGSTSPSYNASGFMVPRDMNVVSVKLWFRPSDDVEYTAKLICQRKTSGTNTATNMQIGSDLVMDISTTNRMYFYSFDVSTGSQLDAHDVIVPLLSSDASGTDYLYFQMCIELEDR